MLYLNHEKYSITKKEKERIRWLFENLEELGIVQNPSIRMKDDFLRLYKRTKRRAERGLKEEELNDLINIFIEKWCNN